MSDRFHVATRKGLFIVERNGGGWQVNGPDFLGHPVTNVLRDPRDGTLYAALRLGHFGVKLHRSSNDGADWDECAVPAYPQAGDDGDGPSLDQIWCIEPGGADQPGLLWAGTIPGGLFRSDDRGDSWTLVESLWDKPERKNWFGGGYDHPGIHSVCVDPRDANHLRVAVSCGGVWVSRDGGESWAIKTEGMYAEYMPPERRDDPSIQDPHRLVQCASKPDCMWVQHHNGVFRTTDGAASWSDVPAIEPSKFGFAVAVHPEQPNTAWFVPGVKDECRVPVDGRIVVARTRDGGETFDVLREGLPQDRAWDIVFRHALDIDASGNVLAFGSTTGSLWVTENGGDSWTTISTHLPPIYEVRFP